MTTLIRIPSFLTKLDKEKKAEMMKQYKSWRAWEVADYFREHLEDELERLILEDEKSNPSSWFESKWARNKRLAKRELIRQILKDL